MKNKAILNSLILIAIILFLMSCSSAAPEHVTGEVQEPSADEFQPEMPGDEASQSDSGEAAVFRTSYGDDLMIATRSNRLIIKDAQVRLLVQNSDIAIDLISQVVGDVGGYIISSRVWYEDWGEDSYKFSTITLGVPVDQFERTLSRLRDLSIRVLDENASGEDVTDQYVDLESQLENLEATRDRVRVFLDQAETVEEALAVNEELSDIEGQIEEIQGRINYLSDRAAYSTITITIEPELPDLPTPTPRATSTPAPWIPSKTYSNATRALENTYKGLIDAGIWILVVVIPVIGPPVVVIWLLWRFVVKRKRAKNTKIADKA
jgi:virulence-associated protein VapD